MWARLQKCLWLRDDRTCSVDKDVDKDVGDKDVEGRDVEDNMYLIVYSKLERIYSGFRMLKR